VRFSDSPSPETVSESEGEVLDLFFYARLFLSHWWIIVPMLAAGAVAAFVFCHFSTPIYRATCRFEIIQDRQLSSGNGATTMHENLARHILLMESQSVSDRVISQLAPEWGTQLTRKQLEPGLSFRAVRKAAGRMIDISTDTPHGDYSLAYLKLMIDVYRELREHESRMLNASTLTGLRDEELSLNKRSQALERQIFEFEREHNMLIKEQLTESDKTLVGKLIQEINRIRLERTALEAQFPFVKGVDAATLAELLHMNMNIQDMLATVGAEDGGGDVSPDRTRASLLTIGEWQNAEATVLRLENRYSKNADLLLDTHPRMMNIRRDLDAARDELEVSTKVILNRLMARHRALEMQEAALRETVESFGGDYVLAADAGYHHKQLQTQLANVQWTRNQVERKIVDTMSTTVDPHFSRFVVEPHIVRRPVWPPKLKILGAGVGGGGMASLALVFVLYAVRRRLYDFKPLESRAFPCLGGVPRIGGRRRKARQVVVEQGVEELANECFRSLRHSLELKLDGGHTLLITSADSAEGKTFLSVNLATVWQWSNQRVLFVDGDLQRKTAQRTLMGPGKRDVRGITDYLSDPDLDWRDLVVETLDTGLRFLPAGSRRQDSSELLATERAAALFAELAQEYDVVIIDSAPANRVVDTTIMARHADATLVIAAAGSTTTHSLRFCLSRLLAGNVIGYALNDIDPGSYRYCYYFPSTSYREGLYQYGYNYRYSYGADGAGAKQAERTETAPPEGHR
jgi:capsular exopolysaccharide synthesis family protein